MTTEATNPADGEAAPEAEVELEKIETPEAELDADGNPVEPPQDETEEVEHEGKKYKIPKPLKGALLMQADYTRKTQEVAEQRRQVEQAQKTFEEHQKLVAEVTNENARVVALNDAIAQYDKVDWARLRNENPKAYDEHWFTYQQTLRARDTAQKELNTKLGERASKANAEAQTQFEKFRSDALREIPEIADPEHLTKLNAYAVSLGFSPQELAAVRDVRIIKALNDAYAGTQAKQTKAVTAKATATQAAKPLKTVTGNTPVAVSPTHPASDRLSAEEWARRRNEQVRKRAGR